MKWTKGKPVVDGIYWFRGEVKGYGGVYSEINPTTGMLDTDFEDEPRIYFIGTEASTRFSEFKGEWYGPITVPE